MVYADLDCGKEGEGMGTRQRSHEQDDGQKNGRGNQLAFWFWLSCKRLLKKPLFVLLLFFLPLGAWLFGKAQAADDGKISIALCTSGSAWNEQVAQALMDGSHSFQFYLCDTEEELERDVASGRAECGYLFAEDLKEQLDKGRYKRAIRLITSPSTVVGSLSTEVVFAGLFQVYGRELLEQYAKEGEVFAEGEAAADQGAAVEKEMAAEQERRSENEAAAEREVSAENGAAAGWDSSVGTDAEVLRESASVWAQLEPLYDLYLENGSTFAFSYETIDGGALPENQAAASFPVRGVGAVFLFIMALSCAVTAGQDEKRGMYTALTPGRRGAFQALSLTAGVLLACLSVLVALLVSGELNGVSVLTDTAGVGKMGEGMEMPDAARRLLSGLLPEVGRLLLYACACAAFAWILLRLVKEPLAIAGLIPFFILGSLVVCPVFVDLSLLLPELSRVRWLFLPWYYLRG